MIRNVSENIKSYVNLIGIFSIQISTNIMIEIQRVTLNLYIKKLEL